MKFFMNGIRDVQSRVAWSTLKGWDLAQNSGAPYGAALDNGQRC